MTPVKYRRNRRYHVFFVPYFNSLFYAAKKPRHRHQAPVVGPDEIIAAFYFYYNAPSFRSDARIDDADMEADGYMIDRFHRARRLRGVESFNAVHQVDNFG